MPLDNYEDLDSVSDIKFAYQEVFIDPHEIYKWICLLSSCVCNIL